MGEAAKKAFTAIDDIQMTAVARDFFFEGMVLPATIYLRMSAGHYLIIGRKGDKATLSSLQSLKDPNVAIWVKTLDHSVLIDFVTNLTSKVISQKSAPDAVKAKFLNSLTEDSLTSFKDKGFASVPHLEKVSGMLIDLSKSVPAFNDVVQLLMDLPSSESKHAMATCMIALALADEMKVNHRPALEKIALGCLLHDVGLKTVPEATLKKPRHLWTPEDIQAYEQHPIKSVEMLRDIKDISTDVLMIVVEHHENSLGTGFPKKLRDVKISPLGKIVILANYFANLLFNQYHQESSYTPDQAVSYIEDILGQPFNKQAFSALKNIINKKALLDKI